MVRFGPKLFAVTLMGALIGAPGAGTADPLFGSIPGAFGETSTQEDGLFAIAGTLGIHERLPRWKGTVSIALDDSTGARFRPQTNLTPTPGTAGPVVGFGYVFPDSSVPEWLGERPRLLVTGRWWSATTASSTVARHLGAAAGGPYDSSFGAMTVDGRLGASFDAATFDYVEQLETHHDRATLSLAFAGDHQLRRGIVLTTSAGPFVGWSLDRYQSRAATDGVVGGIRRFVDVDERISALRGGLRFGAAIWVPLNRRLALHVAGKLGVGVIGARLSASDCMSASGVTTGCETAPGTFVAGTAYATSASDKATSMFLETGGSVSVSAQIGIATLEIGGFFDFTTHSPHVRNPTPPAFGTSPLGSQFAPARVGFRNAYSAGGFLVMRIPL